MSEGALVTAAIRARAEATPQDIALADDSGTRTWSEVTADLERAAGALLAAAPESAQRVSVIGENAIPTLEAHAAALTVGVGTVATSRQLRAGELADQYADADVVAAIAGAGSLPAVAEAAQAVGLRTRVLPATESKGGADAGGADSGGAVSGGADFPGAAVTWPEWLTSSPPVP